MHSPVYCEKAFCLSTQIVFLYSFTMIMQASIVRETGELEFLRDMSQVGSLILQWSQCLQV